MNKQDLLEYSLSIENDICSFCNDEQQWSKLVNLKLEAEFPTEYQLIRKGLPGNHPLLIKRKQYWAVYETKCLVFDYDNLTVGVCEKHLKEIFKLFSND